MLRNLIISKSVSSYCRPHCYVYASHIYTLDTSILQLMVTRNAKNQADLLQKSLLSTVKKPIPTKELLNRLQAVADHLNSVDQSTVELDSYSHIARELADKKLLSHQNERVKAYACCAIADILRIYAPDAPYSEEEQSRIFKAFFKQLSGAWDTGNSHFAQQSYVLTRLVEVRSIILIVDLPDAADLITVLFDTMYELAAKGFPRRLEQLSADMLAAVIAEAETIPKNVVSTIFKSLTFDGTTLTNQTSNISHPGFVFSVAVCEGNIDKMSRQVAQLFSEMLDESVKASKDATSESSYKTLEKIHTWSVQIWKHVPQMLESIIGLIGDELGSDSEKIRVLATKTIGDILAISEDTEAHVNIDSNAVQFVTNHPTTWSNWLKKSSDVSYNVRCAWVSGIPGIINSPSVQNDMASQLRANVKKCLLDSSEKVRLSSVKAVESLTFSVLTSKLTDEEVLLTLFSLLREKDEEIRNLAIRCCCYIYDNYMRSILDEEVVDFGRLKATEIKRVESMIRDELPNYFIQLNYINLTSITTTVDVELFENILPFSNNTSKRCARICLFYSALDTKSKDAFVAIINRQKKYAHALGKYLELSDQYHSQANELVENKENIEGIQEKSKPNKEQIREKVQKLFSWLSATFPDNFQAQACLERLWALDNSRHKTLLKNCISGVLDYKTIKNSIKEFIVSLQNQKANRHAGTKHNVSTAQTISTVKLLLYRASPILFNQSNINEFISLSKNPLDKYFHTSNELLELISSINPDALLNNVETLTDMLVTDDLYNPKNSVETILRSLQHSLKAAPQRFPDSLILTDRLMRLAKEGSPFQSKYSVKILGHHKNSEHFLTEILQSSLPLDPQSPQFSTNLAAIAEICLINPEVVEEHTNDINTVITERVLKQNRYNEAPPANVSWITDDDLAMNHKCYLLLIEKLTAIRYIVNRIRALCRSDKLASDPSVARLFEKPIKLLSLIVSNSGEIVKQSGDLIPTPPLYQSRLRLEAGFGILKLAKLTSLDGLIESTVLGKIGRLMYDQSVDVRRCFSTRLCNYISSSIIPEKFLYLVFLAGHEPDQELKNIEDTWIRSTYQRYEEKKNLVFELALARLIHGIAHDGRYLSFYTTAQTENNTSSSVLQALEYSLKFLFMYLSNISKESNISFLYYIASRVKQYRDATILINAYETEQVPSQAVQLYRIAELCQLMIKEYADFKNFTLQSWPGKMKLPADIFCPMENFEEALVVIGKQYIDDELQVEMRRKLKSLFGRPGVKRAPVKLTSTNKRQKKSSKVVKGKAKAKANQAISRAANEPLRRSSRSRKNVTYDVASNDSNSEEEHFSDSGDDYSD